MLWPNENSRATQMSLRECKFPVSLDNYINQNILQPYWLIHTLIIYVGAALQWHRFIYFSPERKTLHAKSPACLFGWFTDEGLSQLSAILLSLHDDSKGGSSDLL